MNDEATEVELRDNNIEGNTRTRQTRGDTIDLTVDERPKIILTREAK